MVSEEATTIFHPSLSVLCSSTFELFPQKTNAFVSKVFQDRLAKKSSRPKTGENPSFTFFYISSSSMIFFFFLKYFHEVDHTHILNFRFLSLFLPPINTEMVFICSPKNKEKKKSQTLKVLYV